MESAMFAKFFAFMHWVFFTAEPVPSPVFAEIVSAKK
jgi:hypothetical protein